MPSNAHVALGSRLADVDQLMAAHAAVGGNQRGRRFELVALNRASVLLLSAHLEGYLEDLMKEALEAVHPGLSAKRVTERFANPSVGHINDLFEFLGISKVCDQISWRRAGNEAVKRNLNELVSIRNQVAHGGTGVAVRKSEVTRFRTYVVGFARGIDNVVHARVQQLTGVAPWTRI